MARLYKSARLRIAAVLAVGLAAPVQPLLAHAGMGQIRTIDIPPSRPQDLPGLQLDLPSVEEAREADARPQGLAVADPATTDPAVAQAAQAQAAAEAAAARLRAANARQLEAARNQSRQIAADRRAQQERLAHYREQQRAHDAALSAYAAQVAASAEAQARWRADVAACRAGDWSRCGAPVPAR